MYSQNLKIKFLNFTIPLLENKGRVLYARRQTLNPILDTLIIVFLVYVLPVSVCILVFLFCTIYQKCKKNTKKPIFPLKKTILEDQETNHQTMYPPSQYYRDHQFPLTYSIPLMGSRSSTKTINSSTTSISIIIREEELKTLIFNLKIS